MTKIILRGQNANLILKQTGRTGPQGPPGPPGGVDSVNGQTGNVQLDTDDVPEGVSNLYFTDDRVAAAGVVMQSDTSTAGMGFVIDEDDMQSDLDTKVPTQQSVKAYADTKVGKGELVINVKDYGAVGDGVTDDTQAFRDALAGGNKTVYVPEGNYLIKQYLRIQSNTEILMHPKAILLNDSTDAADNYRPLFVNGVLGDSTYATAYDGDSNITIRGGTIDLSPLAGQGILCLAAAFGHGENITINDVTFINGWNAHFLEINACKNVRISGCNFSDVTLTTPGTREAINIDYSYSGGFPFFGGYDNTPCEGVIVRDCIFDNVDMAVGSHAQPPTNLTASNVHIINNTIKNTTTSGIDARYWQSAVISGNYIESATSIGITATRAEAYTIRGNIITGGCATYGIQFTNASVSTGQRNVVSSNVITGITGVGISIQSEPANTLVSNNTIDTSGAACIQTLNSTSEVVISNNSLRGGTDGMKLQRTHRSVISGNIVRGYSRDGIQLSVSAEGSFGTEEAMIIGNRISTTLTPRYSINVGDLAFRTYVVANHVQGGGAINNSSTDTWILEGGVSLATTSQLNSRLSQAQRTAIDALDAGTASTTDIVNALQAT